VIADGDIVDSNSLFTGDMSKSRNECVDEGEDEDGGDIAFNKDALLELLMLLVLLVLGLAVAQEMSKGSVWF
jgi:hypothetical protein